METPGELDTAETSQDDETGEEKTLGKWNETGGSNYMGKHMTKIARRHWGGKENLKTQHKHLTLMSLQVYKT